MDSTLAAALHALPTTSPAACAAHAVFLKQAMKPTAGPDAVIFSGGTVNFWTRLFSNYLASVTKTRFKRWKSVNVGLCEVQGCDATNALETAHRRGFGRRHLIRRALQDLKEQVGPDRYMVRPVALWQHYWSAHARSAVRPVFCLCRRHHRLYDRA